MEALKGALIALSEGRCGAAPETGPDASAGPDHHLTITRGRELAARVAELSSALEVLSTTIVDAFAFLSNVFSAFEGGEPCE